MDVIHNWADPEDQVRYYEEILDLMPDVQNKNALMDEIGEALNAQGKIEECDQYFAELLKDPEDPDFYSHLNTYLLLLIHMRKDLEKASELLRRYIPLDKAEEMDEMNAELAAELYKELGDDENAKKYREICSRKRRSEAAAEPVAEPQVRKPKVYPNDPCPCGSGKKFKKCCKGKGIYD